jgi:SAM-dependent methyltransferase
VRATSGIGLDDVTAVYSGATADLYALLFGKQLHVGGMNASLDLAKRAGVQAGASGIDLCCGTGAAMRLLVRSFGVGSMVGVDAVARNVDLGRRRTREEQLDDKVQLVLADACASGLPSASADFVWGEDAWCYVVDKERLVAEAARLVRPGGAVAFTDWVEGPVRLSDAEAERFLHMMSFANVQDLSGYTQLLAHNRCEVLAAGDTGRFPAYFDLFLNMIEMQLTYDVLATVGHQAALLPTILDGFRFLGEMSRAGKIMQGRFIARRT